MVIDVLHYGDNCRNVVLHIWHFHVADGSARRQLLKLCFEGQLLECINRLGHVNMITVGDIVLVRHIGNQTEPLLQTAGKLISGGLQRRSVQAEINVGFLCPALAGIVQMTHHLQGKRCCLRIGVGFTGHVTCALTESGIAQRKGGVTAVQQLVNGLALFQPCQCAILP